MVQAMYKTQPANEIMAEQIKSWIRTCDLLTESHHFNEQQHWKLPTFQPWYHYDANLCLHQYFYIKRSIDPANYAEWEKQQSSADRMFTMWEEACFRVFQRNLTPIPKCLWYYKLKYSQRGEHKKWRSFFHDTPFQTWGNIEEETKDHKREKKRNALGNPAPANPTEHGTMPNPPHSEPKIQN